MDVTRKCISKIGISIIVCLVLFCPAPGALSFETAELIYDDGNIKLFRIPKPLGNAESSEAPEPMALPKVKVLTAHVGTSDDATVTFPWIPIGYTAYHHCLFEITGSDLIKVIFSVTGREPNVAKTDWIGPLDPSGWWSIYWTSDYAAEGFNTLKVTIKPQKNKVYGVSSDQSKFHVVVME